MNLPFRSILTVCTGNICRSPAAEALLRAQLPGLQLGSAGLGALVGQPMDETTRAVMQRRTGVDHPHHRAQQLVEPLLRAFELVLVAEQGQRDEILARWPFVRGRVFLLTHWTDRTDVLDPYRQPEEVHERSLEQIEAAVRSWASRLGAT